jgi:hypothetical protein
MKRPVVQIRYTNTFPTLFPQGDLSERQVVCER